jgi:hypothetical protein
MKGMSVLPSLLMCITAVFGQSEDHLAIRAILDANGFTEMTFDQVATFNDEGRAVALNLNNPDVTQKGFFTLTPRIGSLTALRTLTANDNDLRDIPEEVGAMAALETLELQSNRIGALPASIGSLSNLKELDLRHNDMEQLPFEICQLVNLRKLQLWGNKLASLPENIGDMKELKELYLRGNRLETFPKAIMAMNLNYLGVQDNRLCELPADLDAWLKKKDDRYRSFQKCWKVDNN